MERQKFKDFLQTKGYKLTKERDEILNEVLSVNNHFDPDGLFVRMKTKGSTVSRASVYRTIPLLIESGLIEEVEKTDKHSHYERTCGNPHHDHMICTKCGKIIEFYSPTLEMLQNELCQKERFKGTRHVLEIMGLCENCV